MVNLIIVSFCMNIVKKCTFMAHISIDMKSYLFSPYKVFYAWKIPWCYCPNCKVAVYNTIDSMAKWFFFVWWSNMVCSHSQEKDLYIFWVIWCIARSWDPDTSCPSVLIPWCYYTFQRLSVFSCSCIMKNKCLSWYLVIM